MHRLNYSGMDIYFDETGKRLLFGPDVTHTGYGVRSVGELAGLFREPCGTDARCYDFYRGIKRFDDAGLFEPQGFRYDITVIMPGTVNGEFHKTSGHYHGTAQGRREAFPEIYEVLEGEAVFVLQTAAEPPTDDTPDLTVTDFCFVKAHAGESVLIPGNSGHCSINTGTEPLVFANIAATACPIHYAPVRHRRGMAYYLMRGHDGVPRAESNPRYKAAPEPRFAVAKELPGTVFGEPGYTRFVRDPAAYRCLTEPWTCCIDTR